MKNISKVARDKSLSDVLADAPIEGPWGRFAHNVSVVTSPMVVALLTFLLVALQTAPDTLHALLWWAVAVAGVSIVPLLYIRRGVRRGDITDHQMSVREQRLVPLLFLLGSIAIAFLLLLELRASSALIATVISVIVVLVIATMVTRYWKISLHLVGIAGAVTVFVLMFRPLFLFLAPLVVLVGWARWQVRAHTLMQVLAGTLLAVSVTVTLFWLFGVL